MRALVVDQRVWQMGVGGVELAACCSLSGRKAAKDKAVSGESREDQGHHKCGRPGDHSHVDALIDRQPHERIAGVCDPRRASVGYQGHRLALLHHPEELLSCSPFVMLVERDLRLFDSQMLEQPSRSASVLAGDDVHLGKGLLRPDRDVSQVPNRCGHQVQHDITPARARMPG